MKIKEILDDIFNEYDNHYTHAVSNFEQTRSGRGDPNSSYAMWKLFMPNILGFVIGLALSKLLGFQGASGYLMFGVIFAVLLGMIDNVIMRKMRLVPALVRNTILTVFSAVVLAIIIRMMGV